MAVIPKYFSQSGSTPAIVQASIDPSTAAAPYRAAEQSTANLTNIFQSELSAWDKTVRAKQAEQAAAQEKNMKVQEGLYKATASAEATIQANNIYNQAKQNASNQTNIANDVDSQFQLLADSVISRAPTENAKIDMTKKMIGMRAGLYNKATNEQLQVNNQDNMNKLEDVLGQYEAQAATNPERAIDLNQMSGDIFASMSQLGVPAREVDTIRQKFQRNMEFHATKALIDQDPLAGVQRASNSEFSHLGPNAASTLSKYAETQVKASQKALTGQLDDTTERLMRGMPIDANVDNTLAQAERYGLSKEVQGVRMLQEVDKSAAGLNLNQMRSARERLSVDLARGSADISPEYADKVTKYFDGTIKAIEEDPIAYGETKASSQYAPLEDIQDFTQISPELAAQRQKRALQMEVLLGVPSPALKKREIDNLKNQLTDADSNTQTRILGNIQALGDRTAMTVAKSLEQSHPALSVAASSGIRDPNLAKQIIIGQDKLKAGLAKPYTQDEWIASSEKTFSGFMEEDPGVAKKYIEAAKALAAADPSLDTKDALQKATNMISVDREGLFTGNYKTMAPVPGMSARQFSNQLESGLKSSADWAKYGNGVPTSASGSPINLDREDPTDFEFTSDGTGMYNVSRAGRKITKADGELYKINLGQFMKG